MHNNAANERAAAVKERLRKKLEKRKETPVPAAAAAELPFGVIEYKGKQVNVREIMQKQTMQNMSARQRAIHLRNSSDNLQIMVELLQSKDYAQMRTRFPRIGDAQTELRKVSEKWDKVFKDDKWEDISLVLTEAQYLKYTDDAHSPPACTQLFFPVRAVMCDPPLVRPCDVRDWWVWRIYIHAHDKADSNIVAVDPWSMLTAALMFGKDGNMAWMHADDFDVAQFRSILHTECGVCLLNAEERLQKIKDDFARWDHRNPMRMAVCSSGDIQLCMSCFAQIQACPFCRSEPEKFVLLTRPEWKHCRDVKPSKNEIAAERESETARNAGYDEVLRHHLMLQQGQAAASGSRM